MFSSLSRLQKTYLSKKPKIIFIDWVNVFINASPVSYKALDRVGEILGVGLWKENRHKKDMHKSMKDNFAVIYGKQNEEKAKHIFYQYMEEHKDDIILFPNAIETVIALYKAGIKTILVSNKDKSKLMDEIDYFGQQANITNLAGYFSYISGASDSQGHKRDFDKPYPQLINNLLEEMGISLAGNDVFWMIGDSETDIKFARNHPQCVPFLFGSGRMDLIPGETLKNEQLLEPPLFIVENHKKLSQYIDFMFNNSVVIKISEHNMFARIEDNSCDQPHSSFQAIKKAI